MQKTAQPILFLCLGLMNAACGAQKSGAEHPNDAKCPPGQSFDGQFCQVDQNVATAETPVAKSGDGSPNGGTVAAPVASTEVPTGTAEDQTTEIKGTETVVAAPVASPTPEPEPEEASPVDITMAAQAGPVIQYLASSHLPNGAKQLGVPFAGQFAEGQVLSQKLQVTEGKCYTVVGVAMPPVTELNIQLFKEGEKEPLIEDTLQGKQAVIGSRNDCYKASKTESLRLVLRVEKGSGVAAAQVFQK